MLLPNLDWKYQLVTGTFLIVDTPIMARNQREVFWDCMEDDTAAFPFRAYSDSRIPQGLVRPMEW